MWVRTPDHVYFALQPGIGSVTARGELNGGSWVRPKAATPRTRGKVTRQHSYHDGQGGNQRTETGKLLEWRVEVEGSRASREHPDGDQNHIHLHG